MREYIYLVEFMYIGCRVLSNVEILRFTFRALNYLIAPGWKIKSTGFAAMFN